MLLTGVTGFLGRFLGLEWLQRLADSGGTLICLDPRRRRRAGAARIEAALELRLRHCCSASGLWPTGASRSLAGDIGEPNLGLDDDTWRRLAETVDLIVHPAAHVNHVLPYSQLFGANVVGTAEMIRLAITDRLKPIHYISTMGVSAVARHHRRRGHRHPPGGARPAPSVTATPTVTGSASGPARC